MMRSQAMSWAMIGLLATATAAGCNLITDAANITLADDDGSSSGDGGSSNGSGAAGAGTATGTTTSNGVGGGGVGGSGSGAGTTTTGAGGGTTAPMANADGVGITDIDLYQGVRRPLAANGSPANSSIPVVAGKDATIRVFYTTDGSYNGQPVTARLTVGSQAPYEQVATLSGNSSQQQLNSTLNLNVPGALLTAGAAFKLELLQPSASTSGSNTNAAFPSDGSQTAMGIEQGGLKLKIKLVPVMNNGSLPDTSQAQVDLYKTYFAEEYPVADVEITVRSSNYTYNGNLGSYNGWATLLDNITALRQQDGAPADQYYYGIHDGNGNGLLGLGWVGGANDVWARNAIGVGWTGDTAAETAVHELGHNHGREHSPCGVSGDPAYPHSGASTGVWGFSPSQNKLFNPSQTKDFMSYCHPQWVSDWTFKALFTRLKHVSSAPLIDVPAELKNRTYDRIRLIEGQATWTTPLTMEMPPQGQEITVDVVTVMGVQQVTGHYYPYTHITGGLLYVMKPLQPAPSNVIKVKFAAEGINVEALKPLTP